MENGNAIALMH